MPNTQDDTLCAACLAGAPDECCTCHLLDDESEAMAEEFPEPQDDTLKPYTVTDEMIEAGIDALKQGRALGSIAFSLSAAYHRMRALDPGIQPIEAATPSISPIAEGEEGLNRHRLCDGCGYALYECRCRATQDDMLKPFPAMVDAMVEAWGEADAHLGIRETCEHLLIASGVTALAQEVERLRSAMFPLLAFAVSHDRGCRAKLNMPGESVEIIKAREALATPGIGEKVAPPSPSRGVGGRLEGAGPFKAVAGRSGASTSDNPYNTLRAPGFPESWSGEENRATRI